MGLGSGERQSATVNFIAGFREQRPNVKLFRHHSLLFPSRLLNGLGCANVREQNVPHFCNPWSVRRVGFSEPARSNITPCPSVPHFCVADVAHAKLCNNVHETENRRRSKDKKTREAEQVRKSSTCKYEFSFSLSSCWRGTLKVICFKLFKKLLDRKLCWIVLRQEHRLQADALEVFPEDD